jgi:hypothetical protein
MIRLGGQQNLSQEEQKGLTKCLGLGPQRCGGIADPSGGQGNAGLDQPVAEGIRQRRPRVRQVPEAYRRSMKLEREQQKRWPHALRRNP